MKIPEELQKKWDELRTHGDNKKIVEENTGINEMDVSRAITNGECRDEVFDAIAKFYKSKERKIKQYL